MGDLLRLCGLSDNQSLLFLMPFLNTIHSRLGLRTEEGQGVGYTTMFATLLSLSRCPGGSR